MNVQSFAAFDTEEQRIALLQRSRHVCLAALQRYDLEWTAIAYIQMSESVTYRITTHPERQYLLRIHIGDANQAEIASEFAFLRALSDHSDIEVPTGVASLDGREVLEMSTEHDDGPPLLVTVMKWLEGEPIHGAVMDNHAIAVGVMFARLHRASALFIPDKDFIRPSIEADAFNRKFAKLAVYRDRFLSDSEWAIYQEAAAKVVTHLSKLNPTSENYGLIHGDLHLGNIVFRDGEPFPIDFGLCGYGYYLYDVASVMLGLNPTQRWLLLDRYESLRGSDPDSSHLLETFFIMIMIENYSHHAPNPAETASLQSEQPYALAYLRKFLDGTTFLFEPIEPVGRHLEVTNSTPLDSSLN